MEKEESGVRRTFWLSKELDRKASKILELPLNRRFPIAIPQKPQAKS
jgi:hypothetical protein